MISILAAFALGTSALAWSQSAKITDKASAIEAAKRYTKGRCTSQAPCTFKADREGKQWRVWVHLSKRDFERGATPESERYVILFFDSDGNLIRRIQGQ
jgi:Tfp pilus assembly protein FimT